MVLVVRLASYNVFSGSLENFRPFFPSFQCPYDKVNSYEKLSKSESYRKNKSIYFEYVITPVSILIREEYYPFD